MQLFFTIKKKKNFYLIENLKKKIRANITAELQEFCNIQHTHACLHTAIPMLLEFMSMNYLPLTKFLTNSVYDFNSTWKLQSSLLLDIKKNYFLYTTCN